jgi:hypothetical protein
MVKNPATGQPFRDDVISIFDKYFSQNFPDNSEVEETATTEAEQTKHLLVNEDSPEYLKKVDLIDAMRQAPNTLALNSSYR